MGSNIVEEKPKRIVIPEELQRRAYNSFKVTIDYAKLIKQGFLMPKPSPYVVLTVDDEDTFRSKTIKRTYKPKWKQVFDIRVTPFSVMTYFVYDECMFKDDKLVAKHTIHISDYLKTYDGTYNELELTIDLVQKPKVDDLKEELSSDCLVVQPGQVKVGELVTVIKGFDMEMAEVVNPELTSDDAELLCRMNQVRKHLPVPKISPMEKYIEDSSKSYLAMCDYILTEYDEYQMSSPVEGEVKNTRAWKPLIDGIYQGLPLHPILLDAFIESLKYVTSKNGEEEEKEEEEEDDDDDDEEDEDEEEEEKEKEKRKEKEKKMEEEEFDQCWVTFTQERSQRCSLS